ncbi:hypothetical protein GMORB2_3562 [Geosmithia morbida]|uniref:Uncharacterized protein n=1 Tax=Geosmithia morbida TaxID=1094350 RepID=A0A9P4YQE4_9HYPO|nr:uncharacterized protein GMORB2_3562 [Geosmithia morbida]KAF4119874.1 hypothetical protein GMORB2_3562 [Geosmithia morbida]
MDASRPGLPQLSSELKTLVCDQLRDIDTDSLRQLRLASREFNDIATPVYYRTLVLNELLVHEDAQTLYPVTLFQNIACFTKHLVIRSTLDPTGVRRILSLTASLSSITWQFEQVDLNTGGTWFPSDVLDLDGMRQQGTRLHIEDLPTRQLDSDTYLRAVPSDLLTSIKVASLAPPLTGRLPELKRLMLHSRSLEAFHYRDRGQGSQLKFDRGERMPPLVDLSLVSYDWNHSEQQVREHWDFSRLESLELLSVPYYNFISSVPRGSLWGLRALHLDDFSAHLPDRRREATALLHDLLLDGIGGLTSLGVTCHVRRLGLDAILRHGHGLESLRLRDHVGFGTDGTRCPTLDPRDLSVLAVHLVCLRTLELDMDTRLCRADQFLAAILLGFPRLETLTLHIPTTISINENDDDDIPYGAEDPDRDQVSAILTMLVDGRPDLPWKQVTINVGGWKRILVRRLSPAWRSLNMRGIFAERCFVMNGDGNGCYTTREIEGGF